LHQKKADRELKKKSREAELGKNTGESPGKEKNREKNRREEGKTFPCGGGTPHFEREGKKESYIQEKKRDHLRRKKRSRNGKFEKRSDRPASGRKTKKRGKKEKQNKSKGGKRKKKSATLNNEETLFHLNKTADDSWKQGRIKKRSTRYLGEREVPVVSRERPHTFFRSRKGKIPGDILFAMRKERGVRPTLERIN